VKDAAVNYIMATASLNNMAIIARKNVATLLSLTCFLGRTLED